MYVFVLVCVCGCYAGNYFPSHALHGMWHSCSQINTEELADPHATPKSDDRLRRKAAEAAAA